MKNLLPPKSSNSMSRRPFGDKFSPSLPSNVERLFRSGLGKAEMELRPTWADGRDSSREKRE